MHGATAKSQIKERLALYERIRRNRASSIQVLSNFGFDETAAPEVAEFLKAEGEPMPSTSSHTLRVCSANKYSTRVDGGHGQACVWP